MKNKKRKISLLLALSLGVTPILTSVNQFKSYAEEKNEINEIKEIEKDEEKITTFDYGHNSSLDGDGNFYKYFKNVQWINRPTGLSLSITPTKYLANTTDAKIAKEAFDLIKYYYSKDKRWKNTDSMENQFYCHWYYGELKTPWNIEPWRTNANWLTCNESVIEIIKNKFK